MDTMAIKKGLIRLTKMAIQTITRSYVKLNGIAAQVSGFEGRLFAYALHHFGTWTLMPFTYGPGSWKKDVDKWRQFGDDRPYHYLGSPWFFAQTGTAFGQAMRLLLEQ